MIKNLNVFVTGGGGFLGRNLVGALRNLGYTVEAPTSKECDLFSFNSLDRFPSGKYDRIYHLAAWTQAGDFCLKYPGDQWINNQIINTNVLSWWSRKQPQAKLVTIGTSCSYSPELLLTEENYLAGQPIESLYSYAQTKRMLWIGQLALQRQFGLNHLTVVPSTIYGPGYHTDGRQLHFIFDLIRKIINAKEHGVPVILWGDGWQKREIIHIDDFVQTTLRLVESVNNEIINIGSGEERTIRDFANAISNIVGYNPADIQYDRNRYTGAKSKLLNIVKLKELMPEYAPRSLEEGLPAVIEWVQKTGVFGGL